MSKDNLVDVTFLNTGETVLIAFKADDDFEVTLSGQTAVMEIERAEACSEAGVLVAVPDTPDDEVLTLTNLWGVDKTLYD